MRLGLSNALPRRRARYRCLTIRAPVADPICSCYGFFFMTMQYRSTGKDDPWHFCQNCTRWPKRDFDALAFANPPLCKECEALCDRGECQELSHESPLEPRRRTNWNR